MQQIIAIVKNIDTYELPEEEKDRSFQIYEVQGNLSASEAIERETQEVITYIAQHSGDEKLRAAFTSQPAVRELLQARQ